MSLAEIDPAAFVENDGLRHDWRRSEIMELFALSFNDLLFEAQTVHRLYFNPNQVQKVVCFQSKPAVVPRIASTVRKVHIIILIYLPKNY